MFVRKGFSSVPFLKRPQHTPYLLRRTIQLKNARTRKHPLKCEQIVNSKNFSKKVLTNRLTCGILFLPPKRRKNEKEGTPQMLTTQRTPNGTTYVRTLTATYIIEKVRRSLYSFWQVRNLNNNKVVKCGQTYEEAKAYFDNI